MQPQARKNFVERTAFNLGFRVSHDGKIVFSGSERFATYPDGGGYRKFTFRLESGAVRGCPVHRLQAFQKFGEAIYADGIQVRHKDGNKANNSADNLLLGTAADNAQDKAPVVRKSASEKANTAPRLYARTEVRRHLATYCSREWTMREFDLTPAELDRCLEQTKAERTRFTSPLSNFGAGGAR